MRTSLGLLGCLLLLSVTGCFFSSLNNRESRPQVLPPDMDPAIQWQKFASTVKAPAPYWEKPSYGFMNTTPYLRWKLRDGSAMATEEREEAYGGREFIRLDKKGKVVACWELAWPSVYKENAAAGAASNWGITPEGLVCALFNKRVYVYNTWGEQVACWGEPGAGKGQFLKPTCLLVDPKGRVIVTDAGNNWVQIFSATGKLLAVWDPPEDPTRFQHVEEVYLTQDGHLQVRVTREKSGTVYLKLTLAGKLLGELKAGDGKLSQNQMVKRSADVFSKPGGHSSSDFNPDLQLLGNLGRQAWYKGERVFEIGMEPNTITRHRYSGCMCLGEVEVKWGEAGAGPGQFNDLQDIACDRGGKVWVLDTGNNRLQRFSPEGQLLGIIGKRGKGPGEFENPQSLLIGADDLIYVADTGNDRVQVLDFSGSQVRELRKREPGGRPITQPTGIAMDIGGALWLGDGPTHSWRVIEN